MANRLLDQWWKLGGAAGIVFVALFIVGLIIQGETPWPNDPAREIKAYFMDNGDQYLIGDWIFSVGFVFFFLPFLAALRTFLGRAEGRSLALSRLTFAAGVIATALGGAISAGQGALAYGAADYADDGLLRTIVAATYYTYTVGFGLLYALLVLSASAVILRTRALWQWLGGLGVLVAIAAVLGTFAVYDDDPFGPLGIVGLAALMGWAVWTLGVSVGMIAKEAPPEAAA